MISEVNQKTVLEESSSFVAVDKKRNIIKNLYKIISVDIDVKTAINNAILYMSIYQCELYAQCLEIAKDISTLRVLDLAETIAELLSDDPQEILTITNKRISNLNRGYIATIYNCMKESTKHNYDHQILVLNPAVIKSEHRKIENQIYIADGGFGCYTISKGNTIFATNIYSDTKERWERHDFLGIAKISTLPIDVQGLIRKYMCNELYNSILEDIELEVQ